MSTPVSPSAGVIIFSPSSIFRPDNSSSSAKALSTPLVKSMKDAEAEEIDSGASESEATLSATETAEEGAKKVLTPEEAAAKKEAEMIDEVADEILKNRIDPIRSAHDGLVQQNDVFTNSLRRTPGGRGREKGISRDVF